MGTGIPKYQAATAKATPTMGAAVSKPSKPAAGNDKYSHGSQL